ncbi:hypothetical protein AAMO2058_001685000, partial [Amorphochlora amoebiformis]
QEKETSDEDNKSAGDSLASWKASHGIDELARVLGHYHDPKSLLEQFDEQTISKIVDGILRSSIRSEQEWNVIRKIVRSMVKGPPAEVDWFAAKLKGVVRALQESSEETKKGVERVVKDILLHEKSLKEFSMGFNRVCEGKKREDILEKDKAKYHPSNIKIESNDRLGVLRGKFRMSKEYAESREKWFLSALDVMKQIDNNQAACKVVEEGRRHARLWKKEGRETGVLENQRRVFAHQKITMEGNKRKKLQAGQTRVGEIQRRKLSLAAEKQKLMHRIQQIDGEVKQLDVQETLLSTQVKSLEEALDGENSEVNMKLSGVTRKLEANKKNVNAVRSVKDFLNEIRTRRMDKPTGPWNCVQEKKMVHRFAAEYLHGVKIHLLDILEYSDLVQQRIDYCKKQLLEMRQRDQKLSSFGIPAQQSYKDQLRDVITKDSQEVADLSLTAYKIIQALSKTMNPLRPEIAAAFRHFTDTLKASKVGLKLDLRSLDKIYSEFTMRQMVNRNVTARRNATTTATGPRSGYPHPPPGIRKGAGEGIKIAEQNGGSASANASANASASASVRETDVANGVEGKGPQKSPKSTNPTNSTHSPNPTHTPTPTPNPNSEPPAGAKEGGHGRRVRARGGWRGRGSMWGRGRRGKRGNRGKA